MFKKPFHIKSNSLVKSSQRRQLIGQIVNDYSLDSKDALVEYIQEPLPSSSFSSHIGDHGVLYWNKSDNDNSEPIWFKVNEHILPTVYTLWSEFGKELLPMIITHKFVVEKLMGGADLMVPGILHPDEGLPKLNKGDKVAIGCWVRDDDIYYVGVGFMEMNTAEIPPRNGKGKAVKVMHMVGDYLWKQGSKMQPVKVIGSANDLIHAEPIEEDNEDDRDDQGDDQLVESVQDLEIKEDEPTEEASIKMDPKEMDAYLYSSLYQTLKTRFNAKIGKPLLPLNSTIFYSNYMMPSAPANVSLDLKNSTFKKLNKFLKVIEKDGLVTLKDISGLTHIKGVKWEHAKVRAHKLHEEGQPGNAGEAQESNAQSSTQASADVSTSEDQFDIRWLYKYPTNLAPIFGFPTGTYCAKYYTVDQMLALTEEDFLKKEKLLSNGQVKVDPHIANLLLSHQDALKLKTLKLDEFNNIIKGKLQHYYQILNGGEASSVKKGMPSPIQVTVESRQGKKSVTKLTNLEAYLIQPNSLSTTLRNLCASSVSVNQLPLQTKEPKFEVLVQGNQVKHVLSVLLDRMGIPKALVDVKDPTASKGGKKKK